MNIKESNDLKIYFSHLSQYYQRPVSDIVLKMYADDLNDLPFDLVMRALESYRLDPKNRTLPIPAQIRAILNPNIEERSFSVLLARSLMKACATHQEAWTTGFWSEKGNYFEDDKGNLFWTWKEAIISECGEISYDVVRNRGGWERLCESYWEMDEGQFLAQLRDDIQSLLNLKKSGVQLNQIAAPTKENQKLEQKNMGELLALCKPKGI